MPNQPRSTFRLRVLLTTGLAAALCAASAARADGKLATVNPVKVLNSLSETKDINNAMNAETQTFQQQAGDRDSKLKDLTAQRDQLKTDAPQWTDLNNQLVKARTDASSWYQQGQLELARKFRDNAKRMSDKISLAVSDIAKAKSIDLVIAEQKPEVPDSELEKMSPQQYMGLLFSQNVIFKSDTIDITQEVITKLESDYKKH